MTRHASRPVSVRDCITALAGTAGFVVGGVLAREGVHPIEERIYRTINRLPESGHAPAWVVMQLGSLGGGLAVSAAVAAKGRPALGRRMAVAVFASWGGSKIIKKFVGRGRPDDTVNASRLLGREASGLGYPSGHAAVAATLAVVLQPELDRRWHALAWAVALVVGPTRSYVGVHLPLDIAGGIFLGVAVGTVSRALVP